MLTKQDLQLIEQLLDKKLDQKLDEKLDKKFAENNKEMKAFVIDSIQESEIRMKVFIKDSIQDSIRESETMMKSFIKQSITKGLHDFWDQVVEPCFSRHFEESRNVHQDFDKRIQKLETNMRTN